MKIKTPYAPQNHQTLSSSPLPLLLVSYAPVFYYALSHIIVVVVVIFNIVTVICPTKVSLLLSY